jgi:hypothetical protein
MLIQEYEARFKSCVIDQQLKCNGSNCMAWEYCDKRVTDDFELTTANKGDFWGFCARTYGPPKCRVKMKGGI